MPVQTVLEDVDRRYRPSINNFLREIIPMMDYTVAKEILSGVDPDGIC